MAANMSAIWVIGYLLCSALGNNRRERRTAGKSAIMAHGATHSQPLAGPGSLSFLSQRVYTATVMPKKRSNTVKPEIIPKMTGAR